MIESDGFGVNMIFITCVHLLHSGYIHENGFIFRCVEYKEHRLKKLNAICLFTDASSACSRSTGAFCEGLLLIDSSLSLSAAINTSTQAKQASDNTRAPHLNAQSAQETP